mmetsp:Transcript_60209/g.138123  ORF Transcript_60209/g.138123 Transcript_60209/m.138123 type:complete len:351 (+) Transcript_60209:895-1947(+)
MTARARWRAVETPVRLPLSSTTSAVSIATSVPPPMATPTSACASAGASLMPSPIIATHAPDRCSSCTFSALSAGLVSARTFVTPSCFAICRVVRALSPETIHTARPQESSRASTAAASGLSSSESAIIPPSAPEMERSTTVCPWSSRGVTLRSCSAESLMPCRSSHSRFPSTTTESFNLQERPCPAHAWKAAGSHSVSELAFACAWMALPIGCSDADSAEAASSSKRIDDSPSAHDSTSDTCKWHVVSVPVLSKMTVSTREPFSSTSPPLNRMPWCAPTPEPTMTAVGVARPIAQGHAITRTAQPNMKATVRESWIPAISTARAGSQPSATTANHTVHVSSASATTAGTK